MALCPLTLNWSGNPTVYVNPANVVAVYPSGDGTNIVTVAGRAESPYQIFVMETADHVAAELNAAAKR